MKLNGTYLTDYVDFENTKCVARIEKGMLYIDSESKVKQPKDRNFHELNKTEQYPRIIFAEKYQIEYIDTGNEKRMILISPSWIQRQAYKWHKKELPFQKNNKSRNFHFGVIAFLIATAIGIIQITQNSTSNNKKEKETIRKKVSPAFSQDSLPSDTTINL